MEPESTPRTPGVLHKVVDHVLGATKEKDNVTPSSSRVYGGLLLLVVAFLQTLIVGTLCFKLYKLDASSPSSAVLAPIYLKGLLIFLLWALLFDVATALSLYGVNVWAYVASIRCGSSALIPSLGDVKAAVTSQPSPIPTPETSVPDSEQ